MVQETENELKGNILRLISDNFLEYLQECGILQAWQGNNGIKIIELNCKALLKVLVQNGFPEENVYEFAADEILKFGHEWKKTHNEEKNTSKEPQVQLQSQVQADPISPRSEDEQEQSSKRSELKSTESHAPVTLTVIY
jgi:hypothetical protein